MSLLDPFLVKTGILQEASKPAETLADFLKNINFKAVFDFFAPIVLIIIVALFLRARYDQKQQEHHRVPSGKEILKKMISLQK